MPRLSRAAGPLLAAAGWVVPLGDSAGEDCWGGDFNERLCCRPRWGLTGNPACWDDEFTYLRCCGIDAFPRLPEDDSSWDAVLQQRPLPAARPGEEEEFDFIVVGAGSSGSVLAARLAAATGPSGQPWRVLLLEDGPWDIPEEAPDPDVLPADASLWRKHLKANWSNDGSPQTWTYATGRGLGGSAAVNSMIYTRGSVSEYREFGWPTEQVLQAFQALEAPMEVPGFDADAAFHRGGAPGPPGYHLSLVSAAPYELPPLFRGLLAAFEGAKVPHRLDPHAGNTIHGVGGVWRSMGCGHPRCQPTRVPRFRHALGRPRQTPYAALVAPLNASGASALRVLPHSTAERVVFNGRREAVGVEVSEGGGEGGGGVPAARRLYRATQEVVLAAGTFGSPKLLALSGVGEPQELARLGIPLVAASPQVGLHLHEHVGVSVVVGTSVPCPEGYHRLPGGQTTHLGDTRDFVGQLYAFLNASGNEPGSPGPLEVEIMVLEGCAGDSVSLTFTVILLQSRSTGRIVVQSRNPFTPPHLDYTPLSHIGDIEILANVIRILYTKILSAPPLHDFELISSPPIGTVRTLEHLTAWIRANIYYYAHPTGTCRIQRDGAPGVVDSHLRVLGTRRLRVADASVFPESPSGHSDGPARLVGQLAARFILEGPRSEGGSEGGPRGPEGGSEGSSEGGSEGGPRGPSVELHGYGGVRMPLLGLGTNGFAGELAQTSVSSFLRLGGRHIDTALLYDNHADIRGILASSSVNRQEVFLVSKLPPSSMGFAETSTAINRIVSELGTRVDLLLIHWPANWNSNAELPVCARPPGGSWKFCRAETWRAMEEAHFSGKARSLGVSNFGIRHLTELLQEPGRRLHVAVNQVEMHPWWPQAQLRGFCAEHRVALTAYGSLGGSLLGGAMLRAESVMQVVAATGRSPAQVLLRWALQQGVAVIPSATTEEHLKDNLLAAEWELSEGDMSLLNSVAPQDRLRVFLPDPERAP